MQKENSVNKLEEIISTSYDGTKAQNYLTAADEQGHFVLKYPISLIDDINMEQVQEVVTRRILHNTNTIPVSTKASEETISAISLNTMDL